MNQVNGVESTLEGRLNHGEKPSRLGVGITRGGKAALLGVFVLLAFGWATPFYEMWYRWYPAWSHDNLSLMERFQEGDSYYSHGLLVPLIALSLAVFVYRRVGLPSKRTKASSIWGWVGLILSLLAHLASAYARVTFVSGFALIGVMMSLALIWGGWVLLRAYLLPLALLVFMVPLPMEMIADLNLQLKFFAGHWAIWATNHIFGVPAEMYDSLVALAPGPDGMPKSLVVEDVCSGLRSLISLIFFATLFVMMCRVSIVWRCLMLALTLPVAIACNICRITALTLVANYFSVEAAGPQSWVHDTAGLAVFMLAVGILFVMERSILLIGHWLRRDWREKGFMSYLGRLTAGGSERPRLVAPMPILAVGGVGIIAAWLSVQTPAPNRSDLAARSLPKTIQIDGHLFQGTDIQMDEQTKIILETNDIVYRRYQDDLGRIVDMVVVFSADNRKGTHPPEVCLTGSNTQIEAKREVPVDLPGMGVIPMRELETITRGTKAWHLYVYKYGKSYTYSFFMQQLHVFIGGLLQQRTSGAMIHLTVPILPYGLNSEDEARALQYQAAQVLFPEIDKNLP